MSYHPRRDLENQLLVRQLAVTFSYIAWLVLAAASLIGLGFCIYFGVLTYLGNAPSPEAATRIWSLLALSLLLTTAGTTYTVMLFLYIRKHIPPNLKEIEYLAKQLHKP